MLELIINSGHFNLTKDSENSVRNRLIGEFTTVCLNHPFSLTSNYFSKFLIVMKVICTLIFLKKKMEFELR